MRWTVGARAAAKSLCLPIPVPTAGPLPVAGPQLTAPDSTCSHAPPAPRGQCHGADSVPPIAVPPSRCHQNHPRAPRFTVDCPLTPLLSPASGELPRLIPGIPLSTRFPSSALLLFLSPCSLRPGHLGVPGWSLTSVPHPTLGCGSHSFKTLRARGVLEGFSLSP